MVVVLCFVGGVVVFCGGVMVSLWLCFSGCVFVVVLLWRGGLEKRVVDECWRRGLEESVAEECCREVLEKRVGM